MCPLSVNTRLFNCWGRIMINQTMRCRSIKRCHCLKLPNKVNWPRLVSLMQHLFSHENKYEITWLKWIDYILLSRTKIGRYCNSQNYSDCIVFSLRSTWKVYLNLCNLHHFDSETSHHCKPSVLVQLSATVMSHPSKNVVISKLI